MGKRSGRAQKCDSSTTWIEFCHKRVRSFCCGIAGFEVMKSVPEQGLFSLRAG
jgi:hypothetical protein